MINVKKTFIFGLVLAIVAAVLCFHREIKWGLRLASQNNAQRASPPALTACERCNLILISLDTVRADRMGFLGSNRGLTPHLDRIAGQSIVFSNTFTNAFFTTPSHMTIFTSLYPTTHRVESTNVKVPRMEKTEGPAVVLAEKFKTLAEILQAQKYKTTWLAPIDFKFLAFSDGFGRGFKQILPSPFMRGLHFPLEAPLKFDTDLIDKAAGSPSFIFVHSYVTHLPYVYGPEFKDDLLIPYRPSRLLGAVAPIIRRNPDSIFPLMETRGFDLASASAACQRFESMEECFTKYVAAESFIHRIGQWQLRTASNVLQGRRGPVSKVELDTYVNAYDYGIHEMDRQVGQLWEDLEKRGLLKNSVVIFLSDHGEELFDHGEGNHSSFYEHTARVPWMIYVPGRGGERNDQLLSLVDVLPTALDILKIESPKQVQGVSAFTGGVARDYVYGASLGVTYVRGHDWKLVHGEHGEVQLFNLLYDPLEKDNLAELRLPSVKAKMEELETALANFKLGQAL